ncbi:MAG: type II toxin-antitoxin system RelE/ParE family toxin [Paenibacillaceae bacterium]
MLDVEFLPPAAKFIKKLVEKPLKRALYKAIIEIRTDPSIGEPKTGNLLGISCYDVIYKGTNYEIAYRLEKVEDGSLIVVILAGTRENFYDQLKRYMK